MFWTAVIWGLGVSFGASIGAMTFVLLFTAFKRISETKAAKAISDHSELVLAALDRRNELSQDQVDKLGQIVQAMYDVCERQASR
jgi:Flp pilus assembly protein TadB